MDIKIVSEALNMLMNETFVTYLRVQGVLSQEMYKEKAQKIYDSYFQLNDKKCVTYLDGDVEKNNMMSIANIMHLDL